MSKKLFKFEPKRELLLVILSLLWLWLVYYLDRHVYAENSFFQLFISLIMTTLFICFIFPIWWICLHNNEGLSGLGITTKRFGISILLSLCLSIWRGFELVGYFNNPNFINTVLFNALCIWEVLFIYGWMYTRFNKSFGKVPACIFTAMSVGIYHIGTLSVKSIMYLMLCIVVCSICYSITENIFTLWPLYWAVGTSSSTLKSGMEFPSEMIILAIILLVLQTFGIFIICLKRNKKLALLKHRVNENVSTKHIV